MTTSRSPVLAGLRAPVVCAPMAGGPTTPALAAAVTRAGGLGLLPAGYLTPERLDADLVEAGDGVGVNLFVPADPPADPEAVAAYARRIAPMAEAAGAPLGDTARDDARFGAQLEVVLRRRVPVASFTFGLPPADAVAAVHAAGVEAWATVTSPEEALLAAERGADALVVQGVEAGGHRGVLVDDEDQADLSLLAALQLVRRATDLPLVAAGAVMTGGALAAVLAAGAQAAQLGSALLRTPEAGTSAPHREAVASGERTVLTRAFSGRTARGVRNRWHDEHGAGAPAAYPELHHLTGPLRARGTAAGDRDRISAWAGQAHVLATDDPAEAVVARLVADARAALDAARARL